MTSLRHFRDALIGVAAYFAVCAAVTDPQPALTKDIAMWHDTTTPTAPEATSADVAITWHHHTETPKEPVRALIAIPLENGESILLAELYDWDMAEGYWVGARFVLPLRRKEFVWAPIDTLLRSAP